MRKATKFIYRIREEIATNWDKTFRPEYSDGIEWKPTHTFSFTWRPFYTSDYDNAVDCIENHKNPNSTVYHYESEIKKKGKIKEVEEIEQENSYAKGNFWKVIWILFLVFALWGTGFLLWSALTCTCN